MLNIMCWNINGIGDKIGFKDVQCIINSHDIVVFLETMKDSNYELNYPGYQCFHFVGKDKVGNAKRPWGGILIMLSNRCTKHIKVTREMDLIVWLTIEGAHKIGGNIHMGFIYMPQERSSHLDYTANYYEMMQDSVSKHSETGQVILCGDFNARTGLLCDYVPCVDVEEFVSPNDILPDESVQMWIVSVQMWMLLLTRMVKI